MRILVFMVYGLLVAFTSLRAVIALPPGQWDKLGHFLVYGAFAVLGFFMVKTLKSYLWLCLGIILYSVLMEFLQSFVPGRVPSFYDIVANTIGVVLGAIVVNYLFGSKGRLAG